MTASMTPEQARSLADAATHALTAADALAGAVTADDETRAQVWSYTLTGWVQTLAAELGFDLVPSPAIEKDAA